MRMIDLRNLLVCPVCHVDLQFDDSGEGAVGCSRCGRNYRSDRDVFNMTPLPLPNGVVKSKWKLWEQLQDNGSLSYSKAPEFNLSIGSRADAQAFKAFAQASGLVLDIGCGPQTRPSYLPDNGEIVGIDPLLGQQPREFSFVQGIGEFLPFRDSTFDHILYASSLDHVMEPKRSLAEAVRCLRPSGYINLWIDGIASDAPPEIQSRLKRHRVVIEKGLKSLSRHDWLTKMGLFRTVSYMASVATMKVPQGAADYFHFAHLNSDTVSSWLKDLDLRTIRESEHPKFDSLFIQVGKRR